MGGRFRTREQVECHLLSDLLLVSVVVKKGGFIAALAPKKNCAPSKPMPLDLKRRIPLCASCACEEEGECSFKVVVADGTVFDFETNSEEENQAWVVALCKAIASITEDNRVLPDGRSDGPWDPDEGDELERQLEQGGSFAASNSITIPALREEDIVIEIQMRKGSPIWRGFTVRFCARYFMRLSHRGELKDTHKYSQVKRIEVQSGTTLKLGFVDYVPSEDWKVYHQDSKQLQYFVQILVAYARQLGHSVELDIARSIEEFETANPELLEQAKTLSERSTVTSPIPGPKKRHTSQCAWGGVKQKVLPSRKARRSSAVELSMPNGTALS